MFSISTIIIAVTAILTYQGFSNPDFFNKYKFNISAVRSGEQYRMLTSGFLHADWFHFAFNMFSFWSFTNVLEIYFNSIQILIIYIGSMFLGSFLSLRLHQNEPHYSAIGASGAVSGVIYSAILLHPESSVYLFGALKIPGFLFAILYLSYSIFGMKGRFDNIGHTAHFGGAVGGLFFTLMLKPILLNERLMFIGLMLIPIVVLYFIVRKDKL
ncbi:rhomboid family intramembrane serine protease [Flavobacterium urocaniciphilum]|uniref:Rhomboid family protein n=1 Tax=Flavobacterium urocaniciphilum TaxID=1299341 RepID=A0A1H9CXE9_9FLAO|nr:rhomboid family intramembrane serine protease [Flavobacterium urocaniciphilum]SEQ05273.1 Rhomboid family protein [Flavobacterium urocaniciphilum]